MHREWWHTATPFLFSTTTESEWLIVGMKERLTQNQVFVLANLRQRGMWLVADETEKHWRKGQRYYLDARARGSGLRQAFERGNREATGDLRRLQARRKRRRGDD